MSKSKVLYCVPSKHAVQVIVTERGMEIVRAKQQRIAAGERWDDVHQSPSLPGEFATFTPDRAWTHWNAEHVTGTYAEMEQWLSIFVSKGGEVRSCELGTYVTLPHPENDGFVLSLDQVMVMFNLNPSDIRPNDERRAIALRALEAADAAEMADAGYE